MRVRISIVPCCLASLLGLGVLVGGPVGGYATLGGALDLDQRDVRVFDNFSGPGANDNLAGDPSFPGATGAELAIWKAVVEWGSELHGNGQGDPHQPGGLGSGGANFDASWQGLATKISGQNGNVFSQIWGSNEGVLAYCETPIADGWRIRFYSAWDWDDGPGVAIVGRDLQGVATHEYGHALGLAHSAWPTATMYPTVLDGGVPNRSIEGDDQAGLHSIYGVRASDKPRISDVVVLGGSATIHGQNFDAIGNEVWFTPRDPSLHGVPVKRTGVPASDGGTRIDVALPPEAGPGDVLVRRPGDGHADLSNAWPLDPDTDTPGAGPPAITGVAPSSVPVVADAPTTITLSGTDFTGLTEVRVGGVALPPEATTWVDDGVVTFEMPLIDALGPIEVVVENGVGASPPALLDVVAPSAPTLKLESALLFSENGIELTVGGAPGAFVYVLVSNQLAPTALPGLVTLDIGAQGSALWFLWGAILPEHAWARGTTPVQGLQFGTVLHFQAALHDPVLGTLPMQVSPAASGTFYF